MRGFPRVVDMGDFLWYDRGVNCPPALTSCPIQGNTLGPFVILTRCMACVPGGGDHKGPFFFCEGFMKHIVTDVQACSCCPYLKKFVNPGSVSDYLICIKSHMIRFMCVKDYSMGYLEPPDWCPLPDAPND